MKFTVKNVVIGAVALVILYYVLKIILVVMEAVFEGIIGLFTSGIIYILIIGFLLFKFRRKIIAFIKTLLQGYKNNTQSFTSKPNQNQSTVFSYYNEEVASADAKNEQDEEKGNEEVTRDNQYEQNEILDSNRVRTDSDLQNQQLNFLSFIKQFTTEEMKSVVNNAYQGLSNQYRRRIGFGKKGCKEFVGAILLMTFDSLNTQKINNGLGKFFKREYKGLDFSGYIEKVVNNSSISSSIWNEVIRYLEIYHSWIYKHELSKDDEKICQYSLMEKSDLKLANYVIVIVDSENSMYDVEYTVALKRYFETAYIETVYPDKIPGMGISNDRFQHLINDFDYFVYWSGNADELITELELEGKAVYFLKEGYDGQPNIFNKNGLTPHGERLRLEYDMKLGEYIKLMNSLEELNKPKAEELRKVFDNEYNKRRPLYDEFADMYEINRIMEKHIEKLTRDLNFNNEWDTSKYELKQNLFKLKNCKLNFITGFAKSSGESPLPWNFAEVIYFNGQVAIVSDSSLIMESSFQYNVDIPDLPVGTFSATEIGEGIQKVVEDLYYNDKGIKWINIDDFLDAYDCLVKEAPNSKYTIYREINKSIYKWYNFVTYFQWNGGIISSNSLVELSDYDPTVTYEEYMDKTNTGL